MTGNSSSNESIRKTHIQEDLGIECIYTYVVIKEGIDMEKFWLYAANIFGIVTLVLLIWWLASTFLA